MKIFCLHISLQSDEFKSHFRMTRGTFEALCREVQATGRVPKFLNQEAMTDWAFIESGGEGSHRAVAEGVKPAYFLAEDMVVSGLELVNLCQAREWNMQFHRKISNAKTGLPFQKFHFFRKFSSGTNRKIVFHLQPNRNFRNLLVNGKCPVFSFRQISFCLRTNWVGKLYNTIMLLVSTFFWNA